VQTGYRIASQDVWVDQELDVLAPFQRTARAGASPASLPPELPLASEERAMIYRGPGWIAGQTRHFQLAEGPAGYRLTIDGIGIFSIARDGSQIRSLGESSASSFEHQIEAILGPALILALALQGTWCLHAGSVLVGGEAVAFLGESGRGKSTLAGYLGESASQGWQRLSDDVLPVSRLAGGIRALPHFPQLKLAHTDQPVHIAPERLRLKSVYLLASPTDSAQPIEINPLPPAEALLAFVRNTIAARLFSKELLASHLEFCQELAQQVPVRQFSYPHDCDRLGEIQSVLAADLEQLH
jgi:hypothetical protein